MRVGFYLVDNHPHAGGGYSFLNAIKEEILCTKDIEIVLITKWPNKGTNNKLKLISIYASTLSYIFFRIKRKIYKLLLKTQIHEKDIISEVFKREKIDILWIPGPYEFDSPVPYIFTVWDIGHRVIPCFPEVSNNGEWENREHLYKKMLYKASYIITGK
jgi:hypothetical protein